MSGTITLMDNCEPLKEYAWLVDAARQHQKDQINLEAAVDAAVEEMPAYPAPTGIKVRNGTFRVTPYGSIMK